MDYALHHDDPIQVNLLASFLPSWRSIRHFLRASISFSGGVTAWLGLWYILETEIWATSVQRNIYFLIVGILLMFVTHSIGGQAGLGQLFYCPRNPSQLSVVDRVAEALCDKRAQDLELREIQRRKFEKPWQTNLRLLVTVYLSSFLAFCSGVIYWVGSYVLIDQYIWPDDTLTVPIGKHVGLALVGLAGMIVCGSLSIESGIWGDNDFTASSLWGVLLYWGRCLMSLTFQVLYWIGIDHICEQDIWAPSLTRNLLYIFIGFILVSLVNTSGGMSGSDIMEDIEREEKERLRQLEEFQTHIAMQVANTPLRHSPRSGSPDREQQAAIAAAEHAESLVKYNVGVANTESSINSSATPSKLLGRSFAPSCGDSSPTFSSGIGAVSFASPANNANNGSANWQAAYSPGSAGDASMLSDGGPFPSSKPPPSPIHRFYSSLRLLVSLIGGILFWEGVESTAITHSIFSYVNDPSSSPGNSTIVLTGLSLLSASADPSDPPAPPQLDDGTAPRHHTLVGLLIMVAAGWLALILTKSFFINAGVLAPISVSRGRADAYVALYRQHFQARKTLTQFRMNEEDEQMMSRRESLIHQQQEQEQLRRSTPQGSGQSTPSGRGSFSDRVALHGLLARRPTTGGAGGQPFESTLLSVAESRTGSPELAAPDFGGRRVTMEDTRPEAIRLTESATTATAPAKGG